MGKGSTVTTSQKLTAVVLLGVGVVVVLSLLADRKREPSRTDTAWIERSAKAETVAVQTTRVVTNTRTRLDSIFARDTLWQHDTVVRVVVESLLVQCERCANELKAFRRRADSTLKVRDDSIATLNRALASCKKHRPWYAVAGFGACTITTGLLSR